MPTKKKAAPKKAAKKKAAPKKKAATKKTVVQRPDDSQGALFFDMKELCSKKQAPDAIALLQNYIEEEKPAEIDKLFELAQTDKKLPAMIRDYLLRLTVVIKGKLKKRDAFYNYVHALLTKEKDAAYADSELAAYQ